jgi:microcystin-dependent protein
MTTYVGNFPSRPFRLEWSVNLVSQNIEENWSEVVWDLWIFRNSLSTTWSNNRSTWGITLNDRQYNGSFTYDFRNSDRLRLSNGTQRIYHNADGGKEMAAYASAQVDLMGRVDLGIGNFGLPVIPRATVPNFNPDPVEAGQVLNINLPRASDTFVHTIELLFGNFRTMFATNVGTSTTYTIPMEVLNQIPNLTLATGIIRVGTYVGNIDNGRWIGTQDRGITLRAPASVVPDFTGLTTQEAVTSVSTNVGAYVQGLSRLLLNITGAAGVYGSTIASGKIEVAGVTINALTGTMPSPITASGTVPIKATVTDSRGRSRTKTFNITVLAYKPPVLTSVTAQRASATGVINEDGANLRININAAVSSLLVSGTQKNTTGIRLKTRARGSTTWTTQYSEIVGGTSFNSYKLLQGFDIEQAWEVQVEVFDYFATSAIMVTIATANIFMHWDARIGVGIGKYRQKGMLDVLGEIYHRDGGIVQPSGMVVATAALTAPDGWLIANGSAVSRTTYAKLFAAIGTQYGAGDGSTTFNLPSLRGRVIVGVDPGQTEFTPQGKTGGTKSIVQTVDQMPAHSHFSLINQGVGVARQDGTGAFGNTSDGRDYTTTTGGNAAMPILQPYQSLLYIIKT